MSYGFKDDCYDPLAERDEPRPPSDEPEYSLPGIMSLEGLRDYWRVACGLAPLEDEPRV